MEELFISVTCVCVCVHVCVCSFHIYTCIHICVHQQVYICVHVYIYTETNCTISTWFENTKPSFKSSPMDNEESMSRKRWWGQVTDRHFGEIRRICVHTVQLFYTVQKYVSCSLMNGFIVFHVYIYIYFFVDVCVPLRLFTCLFLVFYNFMQLVLSFFLQNTGNKFSTCIFLS